MRRLPMLEALGDLMNTKHYGVPCFLAGDGQEISALPGVGGQLLRRLWRGQEPQDFVEEAYMGAEPIDVEEEARDPRTGGFVFRTFSGGSPSVLEECFQTSLVGCGPEMEAQVGFVEKGTPIFLIDGHTDSLVLGVLVCVSETVDLYDPAAFTLHGAGAAAAAPS